MTIESRLVPRWDEQDKPFSVSLEPDGWQRPRDDRDKMLADLQGANAELHRQLEAALADKDRVRSVYDKALADLQIELADERVKNAWAFGRVKLLEARAEAARVALEQR